MRRLDATNRRRLLGAVATLGSVGLAGCNALVGSGGEETSKGRDGTARSETTTKRRPNGRGEALEQTVSVGNPNATDAYVTVVVTDESDRTVFVESAALTPGERRPLDASIPESGSYRVLAETSDGRRETFEWTSDERLDGFSLTVLPDGFDFWRVAWCRDCALGRGASDDVPLPGDGSGRWYAPASLVLENPETVVRTARVEVELDDATLVDGAYEVPAGTQVEVPITYRSGEYRVRVELDESVVAESWTVPGQPSLFVDVRDATTGCGPANSELTVVNYDDKTHAVDVRIESGDEELFAERWTLGADESTSVVPVSSSGRYGVRVQIDDADPFYSVWWSCPPRGAAAVVVDASGGGSLSQMRW
ncbi:hypothetical protein [Halogeometricum limi]|uniref:Ig-like domain-containing protein n=1 Tax=Halogeometricum limi TaxID=555875 RepID=A0A1I6HAS4_9EURY|nr:hypothetical protein [Halogeometricum limi]SFR51596.1 hypothetical protein SAMN04488124_1998 [Halogeometricum limi]